MRLVKTNQKIKTKYKTNKLLHSVGLWATIWWAVSLLYVMLVVWVAKNYYVDYANASFSISAWRHAAAHAEIIHVYLVQAFILIMIGWALIAYYWFKALRLAKLTYKAGLKDLLLTLR